MTDYTVLPAGMGTTLVTDAINRAFSMLGELWPVLAVIVAVVVVGAVIGFVKSMAS